MFARKVSCKLMKGIIVVSMPIKIVCSNKSRVTTDFVYMTELYNLRI